MKQFSIRSTGPENIFTSESDVKFLITQQDAVHHNGGYIVNYETPSSGKETAIALAMISCNHLKRVLLIVDIEDNAQREWTAIKMLENKVMSFNQIGSESGPASTTDRAWISVNNGKRI